MKKFTEMAGLQLEILAVKVTRWTQCCIVPRPPYLHNRGVITGLTGLKKASYRPATLLHFSTSLNCSVIMLVLLPPYYHTSMVWLLFWLKLLMVSPLSVEIVRIAHFSDSPPMVVFAFDTQYFCVSTPH